MAAAGTARVTKTRGNASVTRCGMYCRHAPFTVARQTVLTVPASTVYASATLGLQDPPVKIMLV